MRCYSHSGSALTITWVPTTINLKYPSWLGVKLEETEKLDCTEWVQCKYNASHAPVDFRKTDNGCLKCDSITMIFNLAGLIWNRYRANENCFWISRALRHLLFTKLLIKELPELLSTHSPSLLSKRWVPLLKNPAKTIQNNKEKTKRLALVFCLILKYRIPDLSDHLKSWWHWLIWHFLSLLNKLNRSESSDLFWFKLQPSQNEFFCPRSPR